MNRIALESIAGGRRASVGSQLQQLRASGSKFTGGDADDGLDLFSRTRRSDGDPISRLEKIAVGSTRVGKGMEDLLDAEIGKHDYDWLLTPPETPLYPSAVARESPLSSTAPPARESPVSLTSTRGRTAVRSVSNTRPSRLSASQTENSHPTRPVRSSSVTRPSISSTYSSSSFSNNNRTSVLNTSSASVTSSRPSTPGSRSTTSRPSAISTGSRPSATSVATRSSSTSTAARPSSTSTAARPSSTSNAGRSTSTSRSVPSRLPTPTKTRPNPSTCGDRTSRPANNSRPSTPTSSRSQTPSNPALSSRAHSRPSTPTRRPTSSSGASASNAGSRFPSVGRISSATTRNPAAPGPASRPSSPGPRPRAPVRPIDLPDFPVDAPPNLRTKLPERPASAGRTRPGMALTLRANSNSDVVAPAAPAAAAPASSNRRNYMPVVSRGRFPENPPKSTAKLHGNNGHEVSAPPEIQKISADGGLRRPAKPASTTESTGFGRNISKKSLDMALRHMDIRQGMGGIRASSLFPQSIRSNSTKGRPARKSDPVVPLANDEAMLENGSCNGTISPDCRSSISIAHSENGDFSAAAYKSPDRDSQTTRDSELDLHGSSRYDAFMLREEDSKNMNWLHSIEDKSDQSPVFDHRFEPLPEPFGLL